MSYHNAFLEVLATQHLQFLAALLCFITVCKLSENVHKYVGNEHGGWAGGSVCIHK